MQFTMRLSVIAAALVFVSDSGPASENFNIVDDGKTLTVRAGEKPIVTYNIDTIPSPFEKKPYYARSGHIHPVYTPSGKVVTGDFVPDHPHQHAIWFAWTNTQFDGRKIDFWNQQGQQGKIEHAEVLGKNTGDDFASFRVRLRHLDTTGEKPQPVLNEIWTVRVFAVDGAYAFDLKSEQTCATDKPLHSKQYHYGGMGIRTPMAWNKPDGDFLTSEGKTRANGNHTRPRWVQVHGPVEGGTAGIVVMQHPENFRYPQPARLHPNFGYFSYSPMVLGDFAIKPGETYTSRYRYVVHDGPLDKKLVERLWRELAASAEKRAKTPSP